MLAKSLRGILFILAVIALLTGSIFPAYQRAQASSGRPYQWVNAPMDVIGPLYTQPVDPIGKLYLSARLEPDGSDFDQHIWDNFTLQSAETVTEIAWIGGYDPLKLGMGGPVSDFTVAIYPSIAAGTEPAVALPPLVTYQTGGNAGETAYGTIGSIPMYSYSFTLPFSFAASAGVKYWVHIKAIQWGSSPDWGLAAGTGGNSSHYRWGAGAGGDSGYRTVPGDAAFSVMGLIPDTPTDILLSNDIVNENQPANTVVGDLTGIDPDPLATFTFGLSCSSPGADDASFNINGTNLRTSSSFNFEVKDIYDICIRVTDQNALSFDKNFVIYVNNVNEAPTGISLSSTTVNEFQPVNTVIGALTASDPDAGATFTYSLTCAVAGADDGSFNILGANLRTSAIFNFDAKSTYNICIHVADQGGLPFEKNFVITVNNINLIYLPLVVMLGP
jgi:hypothetical protein